MTAAEAATLPSPLKRVYWETTAACNLRCIHCRRIEALGRRAPEELSTEEGLDLIDQLARMGRPVLVFSGGEPLARPDILTLASAAHERGLPVALSTNGTLVGKRLAAAIRYSGVYYASVSLDGATPRTHDDFRGPGNFERALKGLKNLQEAGLKVQINFTVTRRNVEELPAIYALAEQVKAAALYLFLLVPVGCGVRIAESHMLGPEEVERWLEWVSKRNEKGIPFEVRPICAPHYYRIAGKGNGESRLGCLAGIHMCFVSHKGDVFPCGYLPLAAGNLRKRPLKEIWEGSALFADFRDPGKLEGRCGACEYKIACGGCRARAYFAGGNVLEEEPYCSFKPGGVIYDPAR